MSHRYFRDRFRKEPFCKVYRVNEKKKYYKELQTGS
jgi:hypothetical protein